MPVHPDFGPETNDSSRHFTLTNNANSRLSEEAGDLLAKAQSSRSAGQSVRSADLGLPETELAYAYAGRDEGRRRLTDLLRGPSAENHVKYSESGSVKIGSRNGVAVYCKDGSGEWESTDGKNWALKGSNGNRVWHGQASIKDGNYLSTNSDSGVRVLRQPDGTVTRSITDAKGQKIEITIDSKGVPVRCVDSTGTWTSSDGQNWSNAVTGKENKSTVRIDAYGQYHVGYGGKETIEARSEELTTVMARQERLTKLYGVVFPKPGEIVNSFDQDLALRPPTSKELDCIERVLEKNKQMDLKGLRLAFVQASEKTDKETLWGVHRGSRSEILLYPRNNAQIDGWKGLEGTLQHELVHREQYKNWGAGHWNSEAPDQAKQLLADFGWTYDEASHKYRLADKDGKKWQYNEDSGKWDPVKAGKAEPGAQSISSEAMREKAKVKPSTAYFNFPWEMHAEAQSMYRHDRHQLFEQSRDLYNLMKQYDQREINRKYGTTDGKPRQIRGAEGTLVPNTLENRRAVGEMERRFSENPAPPRGDYARHSSCCSSCCAA